MINGRGRKAAPSRSLTEVQMIHPALFAVAVLGTLSLGFLFGKFHERLGWNQLIRVGVLPKPKGR